MLHIAIFGGTFDPVHYGHLQTSKNIQDYFKFDNYLFLPCKVPAIKSPALANNQQRIKMLELALKDYPQFGIDLREIKRDTPSYMVNTLEHFRKEYPHASINLIIGYDAFLSLAHWYQWEKLISLANLIVINRKEFANQILPASMRNFIKKHQRKNKMDVLNKESGILFFFDAGNYPVSSTMIRNKLKDNEKKPQQLPEVVYQYIKAEGLYQ